MICLDPDEDESNKFFVMKNGEDIGVVIWNKFIKDYMYVSCETVNIPAKDIKELSQMINELPQVSDY